MQTFCIRIRKAALALVIAAAAAGLVPALVAATNIVLWDAGSAGSEGIPGRQSWKPVPADLVAAEADPGKASSDPGYYGREYIFKGDAIVENRRLTAWFRSRDGRVQIYSRGTDASAAPREIAEIAPLDAPEGKLTGFEIIRNRDDEVILKVTFAGTKGSGLPAEFVFGKNGIVEIRPGRDMRGFRIGGPLEYGIAPGFIGDDLIFGSAESPSPAVIHVPAQNLFLGLLNGGNDEIALTWPAGKQRVALQMGAGQNEKRGVRAIDFESDGNPLYLGFISAPGVWHRETLSSAFLEKDVSLQWTRPFPAKWKTELYEGDVKTSYGFRHAKGTVWRGVPGSYIYPAWFDGETAFYHLSKKVPPRGESLIYFLEGDGTPDSVMTPFEIMKATLGRQASEPILDIAGRKLRTHHRRGGDGVHRACTCGCTEAIQAVFEAREENGKQPYIEGCVDDMLYFVQQHVARIEEYRRFADQLIAFLHSKAAADPALKPYLDNLEEIARQIPQEYDVQKENMRSLDYAGQLKSQTLALAGSKGTNNLKSYMELLKAWRGMGGAQDYVVAQCHTITRKLAQAAGYGCVENPNATALAQDIRARCRQVLRNPDGYEIWADY